MIRRVAVLADIHGNLPALEAALTAVSAAAVDALVIAGDVVPGPLPVECLDRLRAWPGALVLVQGDGERVVLEARAGRLPAQLPAAVQRDIAWCAQAVRADQAAWIASWPTVATVEVAALGHMVCCHATPGSDTAIVTADTPAAQLDALIARSGASWVVAGHTHMMFQYHGAAGGWMNPGSVGMPFGAPGAHWALIEARPAPQHTPYDLADAADRLRRSAMPGAASFIANHVLATPSESMMRAAYRRACSQHDTHSAR